MAETRAAHRAVRAVACVEALKGAVVLLAATGLLSLVHENAADFAARLVAHSHLNPASKYPQIFVDALSHLEQPRLMWLAAGAAGYSAIRFVEAYGLYRDRAWAVWLAALSGESAQRKRVGFRCGSRLASSASTCARLRA